MSYNMMIGYDIYNRFTMDDQFFFARDSTIIMVNFLIVYELYK
jgi:hypothetical protein